MHDDSQVLDVEGLATLISTLRDRGFTVMGPTKRDGAIVTAPLRSLEDLPRGWQDEQAPGQYRLRQRQDGALFGFAAPAQSGKSVLFPADELLWRSRVTGDGPHIARAVDDAGPYAFVGLRSCDLRAIQTQDRVLLGRAVIDVHYQARRADTFVVAVGCSDPAGTCFCVSMGSGPAPDSGHDLALTELYADPDEHRFVVQAGSQRGADLLADLPTRPATPADLEAAAAVHSGAVARMGRQVETKGLKDLVYDSVESPRWDDVAARCLACTNCTLVCPTCFCTSIEDHTSLAGVDAERHRVWDSCFSQSYSYIHGGSVRASTRSRYRQWLTHKLASWEDQFDMSGCVGCGRCVTWCPAAIDLTAEAAALRAVARPNPGATARPAEETES